MPKFNQNIARRLVNRKGTTITLTNTQVTRDDTTDWDDETETTSTEQVTALVRRAGTTPFLDRDAASAEADAQYIIYVRDDISSTIYDASASDHLATQFTIAGQTYSVILAPPTSENGVFRCPVERDG